jgi:hypothetical protein
MHDLAVRLLEESRRSVEPGVNGESHAAAVDLLYARLRPVIGPRGFHALFVRAVGAIGDRRPSLATAAACQTVDQGLKELHGALSGPSMGADERSAVVLDVLDSLLGTLERMIGPELTARLAGRSQGASAGGDS